MFPSPCGELRVSDNDDLVRQGYLREKFPSPCGELRVSDFSKAAVRVLSVEGFRPLAGN